MEKLENILNQKRRYVSLKWLSEKIEQVTGSKKINLTIQTNEDNHRVLIVQEENGKIDEYQIDDCFIIGSFEDIIVPQDDSDNDDTRVFLKVNDLRVETQLDSMNENDKDIFQIGQNDNDVLENQQNYPKSFLLEEDLEKREALVQVSQIYEHYDQGPYEDISSNDEYNDDGDDQSECLILDSGDIPNIYLKEILLSENGLYKKLRLYQEQKQQQGNQDIGTALPSLMNNQLKKLKRVVSSIRHAKKKQLLQRQQHFMDIENQEDQEEEKQIQSKSQQSLKNQNQNDKEIIQSEKELNYQEKKKMLVLILSGGKMKKSISKMRNFDSK